MSATGTVSMIRITGRSSKVEVDGRPGAAFEVRGGAVEVRDDGSVDVTGGSGRIRVSCPEHSSVVVSTASGSVDVTGHVAELRVLTSSGRVGVERAVTADLRTRSGSVRVHTCIGTCNVVTSSGKVRIGAAPRVDVSSGSSTVAIERTAVARVTTVSGTITIGAEAHARVAASSLSGTVRITLPSGSAATTRLRTRSGRIVRRIDEVEEGEEGTGATIDVDTSSGTIEVVAHGEGDDGDEGRAAVEDVRA